MRDYTGAALEAVEEIARARQMYSEFNSMHEGFAVLLEEVDELWDEIKKKCESRDPGAIRREAVHVAAMALCIVAEIE